MKPGRGPTWLLGTVLLLSSGAEAAAQRVGVIRVLEGRVQLVRGGTARRITGSDTLVVGDVLQASADVRGVATCGDDSWELEPGRTEIGTCESRAPSLLPRLLRAVFTLSTSRDVAAAERGDSIVAPVRWVTPANGDRVLAPRPTFRWAGPSGGYTLTLYDERGRKLWGTGPIEANRVAFPSGFEALEAGAAYAAIVQLGVESASARFVVLSETRSERLRVEWRRTRDALRAAEVDDRALALAEGGFWLGNGSTSEAVRALEAASARAPEDGVIRAALDAVTDVH